MSASAAPATSASGAMNRRFAGIQLWGTRLTLGFVLVAFTLYVTGALPARVPLERLPSLLGAGAGALLRAERLSPGWAWLGELGHGDLLSLGGLVAMGAVVAASYLGLVPLLVRRRDWAYLVLVLLQLLVFAMAAGLLV